MVPKVLQVDITQSPHLLLENVMWQVVLQQVISCACLLLQHGEVITNVYQLCIDKIKIFLPKFMYIWATSITRIGPKVTMRPKNTPDLLWSNTLFLYGEKIQILNGVINK